MVYKYCWCFLAKVFYCALQILYKSHELFTYLLILANKTSNIIWYSLWSHLGTHDEALVERSFTWPRLHDKAFTRRNYCVTHDCVTSMCVKCIWMTKVSKSWRNRPWHTLTSQAYFFTNDKQIVAKVAFWNKDILVFSIIRCTISEINLHHEYRH